MDPVTYVGLAASCASLVGTIFKVKSALSKLYEKFKSAQVIISSLVAQLSALEASAAEFEAILAKQNVSSKQGDKLSGSLQQSLALCNYVILYLSDQVSDLTSVVAGGTGLTRWSRTKYVFNEAELAPMREALRDQVQAIQLLLSVAMLRSEREQNAVLDDTESTATLRRARDDSSSLLWLRDADSRASLTTLQTDTLSRLSMMFNFDGQLLDSGPYRAAVITSWKKLRTHRSEATPLPVYRHKRVSMRLDGRSDADLAYQLGDLKSTVVLIVLYDFRAELDGELECSEGEVVTAVAAHFDRGCIVAVPIQRLGGPGLVPARFVRLVSRSGNMCSSETEIMQELQGAGIPNVAQWEQKAARIRESCIELGKLKDTSQPPALKTQIGPADWI